MTKRILLIITIIFFAGMLFLTFFAEKIHESTLPKVTAARPERQPFPYEFTDKSGERRFGTMEKLAVPKTMLENGVFVVYSAEKNGTERDFVRLAELKTGAEYGDYVEVISGITIADSIVFESTGALYNDCEVIIGDNVNGRAS